MNEYFVTCSQMKILEQNTDAAGLSYYQMMENAGTIAANRIAEITITSPISDAVSGGEVRSTRSNDSVSGDDADSARYAYQMDRPIRVRVYVGKGNNGGDGYVAARLLHQRGWDVEIVLVDGEPTTSDAIANYKLAQTLDIPILGLEQMQGLPGIESKKIFSKGLVQTQADQSGHTPDVVVDAIYGTGFHGQLRENGARAAAQIALSRSRGARVFAMDIPSGVGGDLTDESELDPRCVQADVTITFHAKKPVHLQTFAGKYCGRILTADIGIVDPEREAFRAGAHCDDEAQADAPCGGAFGEFVGIISRLRAPGGCPWDREQTHETLKKYLLEETGEAADAIDNHDDDNLCEELGDVLLQIVLHAQIAKERGAFTIEDVLRGISEKMIRRHPWVFGDVKVETPEEGERLWEQIKQKEKAGLK